MKVKVARTAGFCEGVRAAANIALDAGRSRSGSVFTLGPLVHNPQVVEMLESVGVHSVNELPAAGTVVIRAHGITPQDRQELERRQLTIIDAACPRVAAVHQAVKRRQEKGFQLVVLGDRGHPEVEGILGASEGRAWIVESPEEVRSLPEAASVCLVAQTTQERERFEAVAEELRRRYPRAEVAVVNTICPATRERQEEVRRLAAESEAIVVVGGPESANTRRLAEVAKAAGVPVFLVGTEEDLDREALARFRTIGLTAGASTPDWMIRRVYDALISLEPKPSLLRRIRGFFSWLILANLYVAFGAAALTAASGRILDYVPSHRDYLINFLFVFAAHTSTLLANPRALALNVPRRARSFMGHRSRWLTASFAAAVTAILIEFSQGLWPGLLLLALAAVSVLYPVQIVRTGWEKAPIRSLAEIPGSKDIFMALGWGALIVAIPLARSEIPWPPFPSLAAALILVMGLVFVRALLRDFRDLQADRLIGRETLPLVLGVERTRQLLYTTLIIVAAVLVLAAAGGFIPPLLAGLLLLPPAAAGACVPLFTRQRIIHGFGAEAVIDAVFLLAGLAALLA